MKGGRKYWQFPPPPPKYNTNPRSRVYQTKCGVEYGGVPIALMIDANETGFEKYMDDLKHTPLHKSVLSQKQ